MEVAAGVVPLDLRFCEIAIRDVMTLRTGYSILNDYRHKLGQDCVNVVKWRQCSITYFSDNRMRKRVVYCLTDLENS